MLCVRAHYVLALAVQEMVAMGKEQAGYKVPNFLVSAAIKIVQQAVLKRSGMDLNKLKPIENVDKYARA